MDVVALLEALDADMVAAIAACVAALASLGALGTGVYAVRHTSKQAAGLERVKWTRDRLNDAVKSVMSSVEDHKIILNDRDEVDRGWDAFGFHRTLKEIANFADKDLAVACEALAEAASEGSKVAMMAQFDIILDEEIQESTDNRLTEVAKHYEASADEFLRAACVEMDIPTSRIR